VKYFESASQIAAAPDLVWSILVDGAGFTMWDSGVERFEGSIAPGAKLKVTSSAQPGRAFPVKVTDFQPERSMTWTGGMPLGLFKGERTYRITPVDGGTAFAVREEYTGLMLPLIWRSIPDLQPSFDRFARGLKAEAERRKGTA
jgi:hypothetical protein